MGSKAEVQAKKDVERLSRMRDKTLEIYWGQFLKEAEKVEKWKQSDSIHPVAMAARGLCNFFYRKQRKTQA